MNKRGRKRDQLDENKAREEVTKFMAKLREAIVLDKKNMERHQPALAKLKLVGLIQKFLSNYYYQKIFLEYNGLELLQDWLKKNPDGSLPVLNQVITILDVLASLSVSLTNLRNCTIGSYVMDLKQIKLSSIISKKASEIVEKWSRIVWNINTDYSDIDLENKYYKLIFSHKKRNRLDCIDPYDNEESKENASDYTLKNVIKNDKKDSTGINQNLNIYSHAKIPKKALFDFTIKPKFNESENTSGPTVLKSKFHFGEKPKSGRHKVE